MISSTNKHLAVLFSGWGENHWKEINTWATIQGNAVCIASSFIRVETGSGHPGHNLSS